MAYMKRLENKDEFNSIIKEGKWLVDFSATWCGPCRMLEPNLVEFAKDNNVLQVDIDKFSDLTASFNIMSVPTLMIFENGKLIKQTVGYKTVDELCELVK